MSTKRTKLATHTFDLTVDGIRLGYVEWDLHAEGNHYSDWRAYRDDGTLIEDGCIDKHMAEAHIIDDFHERATTRAQELVVHAICLADDWDTYEEEKGRVATLEVHEAPAKAVEGMRESAEGCLTLWQESMNAYLAEHAKPDTQ